MRICFASNNPHKIREVQNLLGSDFELVSLQQIGCNEEPPEEQETIEGNSFQKADYVFRGYHRPCFSDDSGLEVAALHGAPGVHSAMYAGNQRSHDDNMNLLLKNLQGIDDRTAQFKTVITFLAPGHSQQFEGIVKGSIQKEKRGTEGFGYDPLFVPDGFSKTFAEMSVEEKNKFSHRSIAVRKFVAFLKTANLDVRHE